MYTSSLASSAAPRRRTLLFALRLPGLLLTGLLLASLLLTSSMLCRPAAAAPSGITYLGQLLIGGVPANGSYDFQFKLYDAATGGNQVGSTVSLTSVRVADGVYYASLFFGTGVITGQTLWLQISYRVHPSSGNPAYTTISPRQVAPNSAFADYAQLSGSTAALQNYPISTTAPATGQVLQWSGSLWTPATVAGGTAYTAGTGLTLSGTQFSVASGGITNSLLANGVVSNAKLADGSVTSTKIADGSVTNSKLANGSVTNAKLADGSVTNSKLASASVTGSTLALPLTASVSSDSDLFSLNNTSTGAAIAGNNSGGYAAIVGTSPSIGGIGIIGSGAGTGVYGVSSGGVGIFGASSVSDGMQGQSTDGFHAGVAGVNSSTGNGVYGRNDSTGAYGSLGSVDGSGTGIGVVGDSQIGVEGRSHADNGFGIWGIGDVSLSNNYAGLFSGNVYISGTLSKAGGSFKIDDPIDPAHKFLSHSFVESPDMKNIYDGTITTNATGDAVITMPKWFEALNQDFRYQLTVIGQFAQAVVATKMHSNTFAIKTDKPNVEVSWQVTGTRHDAWANAHRIPLEEDKPEGEQGLYLNPDAFGLPASMSVHAVPASGAAQARPALPKPSTATQQ